MHEEDEEQTHDPELTCAPGFLEKHAFDEHGRPTSCALSLDLIELQLARLEENFAAGEQLVLMEAIAICATTGVPLPEWAAKRFLAGFRKVQQRAVGSWDDVFGRPNPKGTHLKARRRRDRLHVVLRVHEIVEADPTRALDDLLFEEVAASLGIKKSLCKKEYYARLNAYRDAFDGKWLLHSLSLR